MNLKNTEELLKKKMKCNDFDSYAVLVAVGEEEKLLTSSNVNKDTYFDMASMGKVLVTSTLILRAVTDKKLDLTDTINKFFPNAPIKTKNITIQQMLTHTSGIVRITIPDRIADGGRERIAEYILQNPLAFEPGSDYIYSCNAYILLGFILEKIYDMHLDEIYYKYITKPLGLTRSCFNIAINEENAAICYRCETREKIRVDDENVYAMGGVAGNGASQSSVCDIQKFIKAVLRKDERLYSKELFELAEKNYTPNFNEGRGLGYLVVNSKYKQTGALFPCGSFGHCGHTGTSFFINRDKELYVIILTNATRFANLKNNFKGYDYGDIMKMREEIHNAIKEDLDKEHLL